MKKRSTSSVSVFAVLTPADTPAGAIGMGRETVVTDIMRRPAVTIPAGASLTAAAMKMRDEDVGLLIVVENDRVIGVVTDRDIVTRAVASPYPIQTRRVGDVTSRSPQTCRGDQRIDQAAAIMGDFQVRRLPVLDTSDRLIGVLSLDQIAEDFSEHLAGETLGEIVETR